MTFIEALRRRATSGRRRIVFPEGADERIQQAARYLESHGIADPVLLLPGDGDDPILTGARMLAEGKVDGCVAGAVATSAEVLRAGLKVVGLANGNRTLSSAFYMVGPAGWAAAEVLTFTDCAVVPNPTPSQLADIAICAARDRRRLVGDDPVVALLSYSSVGSAAGPSVDTVREALTIIRTREPALCVDGELQGDSALAGDVAARKAPGSPVAGKANVLVFPSLDAGNIAYKLVQRLSGAKAIGPILQGLQKPMADLSRGADVEDIINVAAITALQSVSD